MNRLPIVPFLLLTVLFAGCASTPSLVDVSPPPNTASPLAGYSYVEATGGLIKLVGPSTAEVSFSVSGPIEFSSMAPNGESSLVAIGGSLVYVGRASGTMGLIHEGPSSLQFTAAWSSSSEMVAFGFYEPAGNGMGPGGIHLYDPATGEISDVGCSASKAVLSMLPDGSLLVRNADNLYQVSAEGCNTIRSVDARKLYHVTSSPDGKRLAYVLRDLVFNRDTRAYDPDSTLYIESTSGSDPIKVIGDKYSPRNVVWSPDGSELMYDVQPPEAEGIRAISIYSISDARSSYLLPPGSVSATNAVFSPDGRHVIYRSMATDGVGDWMIKTEGVQFSQTLPLDALDPHAISWIDSNTFLIPSVASQSQMVKMASGTPQVEVLEETLIAVWPSR